MEMCALVLLYPLVCKFYALSKGKKKNVLCIMNRIYHGVELTFTGGWRNRKTRKSGTDAH